MSASLFWLFVQLADRTYNLNRDFYSPPEALLNHASNAWFSLYNKSAVSCFAHSGFCWMIGWILVLILLKLIVGLAFLKELSDTVFKSDDVFLKRYFNLS